MSPTLIAVIVVTAVAAAGGCCLIAPGIAAVVMAPKFEQVKADTTRTIIATTMDMLKLYRLKKGVWPDLQLGLRALVDAKICDQSPKDAWGNDLVYALDERGPYVISFGKDGLPGGQAADADITSRDEAQGQ